MSLRDHITRDYFIPLFAGVRSATTAPAGTYNPAGSSNNIGAGACGFNAAVDSSVTKPVITFPANGATDVPACTVVTSSAFSATGGQTHVASRWIIYLMEGSTQGPIVADSGRDVVRLTSVDLYPLRPAPDVKYRIIVRYQGSDGGCSAWSDPVDFTMASCPGLITDCGNVIYEDTFAGLPGSLLSVHTSDSGHSYVDGPFGLLYTGQTFGAADVELSGSGYIGPDSPLTAPDNFKYQGSFIPDGAVFPTSGAWEILIEFNHEPEPIPAYNFASLAFPLDDDSTDSDVFSEFRVEWGGASFLSEGVVVAGYVPGTGLSGVKTWTLSYDGVGTVTLKEDGTIRDTASWTPPSATGAGMMVNTVGVVNFGGHPPKTFGRVRLSQDAPDLDGTRCDDGIDPPPAPPPPAPPPAPAPTPGPSPAPAPGPPAAPPGVAALVVDAANSYIFPDFGCLYMTGTIEAAMGGSYAQCGTSCVLRLLIQNTGTATGTATVTMTSAPTGLTYTSPLVITVPAGGVNAAPLVMGVSTGGVTYAVTVSVNGGSPFTVNIAFNGDTGCNAGA